MFRSLLFIPGNNPSMLQNADIFMSDGIIFDLEDAVSVSEKDNARNLVETYLLTTKSLPKQIVLRVNPVNTEYIQDDLKLLLSKKIDYILLPKSNMISLFVLDKLLSNFEKKYELKQTKVICLIEETKAVLEVNELAKHSRVEALLLGAEDLTNELEIERSIKGDEIQFARSQVIYAAIANKIIPIDTPFTDISDTEGLEWDCQNAQSLGMKAKTAIHPNQLEKINEIFSPSTKMIEWAKGVVDLAEKSGKGVFQFKGKMVDKPVIDKAYKILEKAKFFDLL
ncbi:CoA ester lyase [Hujiaoplasma nucleasis]|uniref:CoA ester lyase n=1 Tax=Hujiaoplasma nucleasis TaxID=2725268 RepID=A0A7L6N4Q1_9MOLU|nr:CoA ester lyase [Hujiaoplasma nucleasis]QLY40541.1 CoA ester lyase [Hujiaoplasma nucleasis]